MRGRRRTPVVLGLLLVAVIAAGSVSHLSTATGDRRPLILPAGVLVPPRLTVQDLRGRPAIVHYWATWCEPCRQEAPEIARLARRLGRRARLVGVDWSDDRGRAVAFARRHGWSFPILADPRSTSGRRNGLVGLPMTLIVDADGRIVERLMGAQTAAGLLARLP